MARIESEINTPLMYILGSDGTIRLQVDEGTEGAKLRKWETVDGKSGEKWELVFKGLEGTISNIQTFDGDYGKNLLVTIKYDGGEDTLSITTNSAYGEDFMKRLPSVDLDQPIKIVPYCFPDPNTGKMKKGITIYQKDRGWEEDKAPNFFFDPAAKKNLHKYPEPEGDRNSYDTEDWKMYFTKARKFLIKYIEDHIMPKYEHLRPKIETNTVAYPDMEGEPTI